MAGVAAQKKMCPAGTKWQKRKGKNYITLISETWEGRLGHPGISHSFCFYENLLLHIFY
jgi:hypothetical protein